MTEYGDVTVEELQTTIQGVLIDALQKVHPDQKQMLGDWIVIAAVEDVESGQTFVHHLWNPMPDYRRTGLLHEALRGVEPD